MILYRLLIILLSPIIIWQIVTLSIKNKQSRYFFQRIGFHYKNLPKNSLWFHCASVGEVNTLLPLLKNIHKKNKTQKIIVTTNTITGGKIIEQQKLNYLFHSYLPFDWLLSTKKFISTVNPTSIYIMETELWPNLFTSCHRASIPIHIINARLSNQTTSVRPFIKRVYSSCLSKVSAIYARSDKDVDAYISLGGNIKTTTNIGNLKFTTFLNTTNTNSTQKPLGRKYILVASTHEDEELKIYNIWKTLKRNELLIIAPRHPERCESIVNKISTNKIAIRSKNHQVTEKTKVFLLDTVGELKNYFNNAEIVIMGGSFTSIGGHNILEPASYNRAIITGPYMKNFSEELSLMLDKNAIIQITSTSKTYAYLGKEIKKLLEDINYRETLQNNTKTLSNNAEKILKDYTKLILRKL